MPMQIRNFADAHCAYMREDRSVPNMRRGHGRDKKIGKWRSVMGEQLMGSASSAESAVIEAVEQSMTQEERDFGSLPDGQILGRYALETYIEFLSSGFRSMDDI